MKKQSATSTKQSRYTLHSSNGVAIDDGDDINYLKYYARFTGIASNGYYITNRNGKVVYSYCMEWE